MRWFDKQICLKIVDFSLLKTIKFYFHTSGKVAWRVFNYSFHYFSIFCTFFKRIQFAINPNDSNSPFFKTKCNPIVNTNNAPTCDLLWVVIDVINIIVLVKSFNLKSYLNSLKLEIMLCWCSKTDVIEGVSFIKRSLKF